MSSGIGSLLRLYHQPLVVGLVLLAVLIAWNVQERGRSRDLGLREVVQATHGVAETIEASVQAYVRRGRLDVRSVQIILDSVVAATDVTFVALTPEHSPTIAAGHEPADLRIESDHGGTMQGGQYIHWDRVRLQASPLPYRHRYPDFDADDIDSDAVDLGDAPQLLVIGMRADGYARHVGEAAVRLNAILAVGVLCIVGLSLAWTLSIRNRDLRARLAATRLRAEHLGELEHAARGLAHETKNPLGLVRGMAQRIAGDESAPIAAREAASAIMEQADTASARLDEFLAYARPRQARPRSVAALGLAHRVCQLLAADFEGAGVRLTCGGDDLHVVADPQQLEQILVNLLLNSLAASTAHGTVDVVVARAGSCAELSVVDDGAGVDPALRDDVFKPYVTGRSDGHGLGLAIVRRIVEEHAWTIELRSPIESGRTGGTNVTISGIAIASASGTGGTAT